MDSELIELYLKAQELRLAKTTIRNRRYTLRALEKSSDPETLFKILRDEGLKPYSIKTTFIEIAHFYQWLIDEDYHTTHVNAFKRFMRDHGNLFKHAYEKERLDVSFEEAKRRVNTIRRREVREKALQLLCSGMRFRESLTLREGKVKGKGGKHAPVFVPTELEEVDFSFSYSTFYRELKKVGLKPHTLRKLAATRLVEEGASEADLMRFMRWESIKTAASYVQARRDEELQDLAIKMHKG